MKAKKEEQHNYSVTIPLLFESSKDVGTKQVEEQYNNIGSSGTTSFMSTCFNGLNALS
ncbi:hypothetical protein Tco_1148151, partial [Tanacetum coccineum]